jgi:hypothetical protein
MKVSYPQAARLEKDYKEIRRRLGRNDNFRKALNNKEEIRVAKFLPYPYL